MTILIDLRKNHPALRRRSFFRGRGRFEDLRPDVIWHGVEEGQPDFSEGSRTLAFVLAGQQTDREPDRDFYVACNGWIDPLEFRIPMSPSGKLWRRQIDTSLASPDDIMELDAGPVVASGERYEVKAHSMIVLIAERVG